VCIQAQRVPLGDSRNRDEREAPWITSRRGEVHMNKDQTQGAWDMFKGKAKRIWGELTDDDIKKAEGSVDKLIGTIEKRFGDTKEQIKAKIDGLHIK
jgi:uncharacterized protein YjbJ (UPF0337 family)